MKRFQSILFASVLTLALTSTAFGGNISTIAKNGNISTIAKDGNISTKTGNISTISGLTDELYEALLGLLVV